MDNTMLIAMVVIPIVLFVIILILFLIRQKKNKTNQSVVLQSMLNSGGSSLSGDAFLQKVYIRISNIPIIKRYVYKIRRRLEILNNDDEYIVRKETAKIALRGIIITLVAAIGLTYINRDDLFMIIVSLIGVLVVMENITDMMVNKIEDTLLKQQLELFSEVRHAFHETSMIEEAIYDASLLEDYEITLQADRIYEIMISNDPELELEKYYDVAPNRFLKAFAGVSYLTKEFGDRKIGGVSLYLKNLNNITQELQLEILKRDKLDYMFKSLTFIALAPIVAIKPLKAWAIGTFESTRTFYEGKLGYILQIVLLVLIFLCYSMLKRVKENNDRVKVEEQKDRPWQERIYHLPIIEQFIDNLMPNASKREYVKIRNLLLETSSPLKIEWLYVNRFVCMVVSFFAMIVLFGQLHSLAVRSVLYSDTMQEGVLGSASDDQKIEASDTTDFDRYFILTFKSDEELVNQIREAENNKDAKAKNKIISDMEKVIKASNNGTQVKIEQKDIRKYSKRIYQELAKKKALTTAKKKELAVIIAGTDMKFELPIKDLSDQLASAIITQLRAEQKKEITEPMIEAAMASLKSTIMKDADITTAATRIYDKLAEYSSEYIKYTEILIAFLIAYFMYHLPVIMLQFQRKMRQIEMEDEVMQFQTIILMLMHIERVSVEYIIEWLERFSNIFKVPLSTCLNNYENGAWAALEQLKEEAPFKPFVRIVESLQSAVENVPIPDAFDELETERNFFQEKRKEANERLIAKKAKIGQVLGFAPMVFLFIVYLIVPLIWVSMGDMASYFGQMNSMI